MITKLTKLTRLMATFSFAILFAFMPYGFVALEEINFSNLKDSNILTKNIIDAADTCAADPTVTNQNFPTSVMIGEDVDFQLLFTNPGSGSDGYGPFVDMILPAGADGDDGLSFNSATFLGTSLVTTLISGPVGGGMVDHPYAVDNTGAPLQITLAEGETLIVLQLPFGSFVQDQVALEIDVSLSMSNLADASTPLDVQTRGGFQYGCDALDNPSTDPSDTSGTFTTEQVTPTVFQLTKTFLGGEDESVSGPNHPLQYQLDIDIAEGQNISNLIIEDVLPSSLHFLGVASTTPAAIAAASNNHPGGVSAAPNNVIAYDFGTVTGTSALVDASLVLDFYIADEDASGAEVIPHATGDDTVAVNDSQANGGWVPLDPRDGTVPVTVTSDDNTLGIDQHEIEQKTIATQKSLVNSNDIGGTGFTPGDQVTFTIEVQVSDYFGFDNIMINDVLSDGLRFDPSVTPTLTLNQNGTSNTYNFDPAFYVVGGVAGDGSQPLNFDISAELNAEIGQTNLLGGCIPDVGVGVGSPVDCSTYNDGATTMSVTYATTIQDAFDVTGPDTSIDLGDRLNNNAVVSGEVLENEDLALTGNTEDDDTTSGLRIAQSTLSKSIAYINGCDPAGNIFGGGTCTFPTEIAPGDIVTYVISQTLPSSDYEDLLIIDYLPLPVFQASSVNATPNASFSNPTNPLSGVVVDYGPNNTFNAVAGAPNPTVSVTSGNAVVFDYGDFDDPSNTSSVIELLLSTEVSNQPFADGLNLTNQAASTLGSTNGEITSNAEIVQITLGQPDVNMTKGIISTTNTNGIFSPATVAPSAVANPANGVCPVLGSFGSVDLGTVPIDSNLSNVNGGDTVTFVVTLENEGESNAGVFDVTLTDTVPVGFIDGGIGTYNLCVMRGDGTILSSGADYTGDMFNTPLEIVDGVGAGGLGSFDETDSNNGENIIVVTYDLVVDPANAIPNQDITNTATLTNFASTEGGPDFTADDKTDDAIVTVQSFEVNKSIINTSLADTGTAGINTLAAIGEIIEYEVEIEVPGESVLSNVVWYDQLPSGMALYDNNGVLADTVQVVGSAGISASAGALATLEPTVTNTGRDLEINLGSLVNTDTDDATTETLTFTYQAVVLDQGVNVRNTRLRNNTRIEWDDGSGGTASEAGNRPEVRVVEPNIILEKGNPTNAASNDDSARTFTYDLEFHHDGNTRQSVAYDFNLLDDSFNGVTIQGVPNPFTISNIVTTTNGTCSATTSPADASTGTILDLTWTEIPLDCSNAANSVVVTFDVTLNSLVTQDITAPDFTNTADITYYSLPDDESQQSSFVADADESDEREYTGTDSYDVAWIFSAGSDKCLWDSVAGDCHAAGYDVVVGDTFQYRARIEIPEDTVFNDLTLTDTMDSGLALVEFNSISSDADVTNTANLAGDPFIDLATATAADLDTAAQSPAVTEVDINVAGDSFTIQFGNVTHADNGDDQLGFIDVIYTVAVLNQGSNTSGVNLNNNMVAGWESSTGTELSAAAVADNVTVREPELEIEKVLTTAPIANGRTASYTLTVNHTGASVSDDVMAYDVRIVDDAFANAPNTPLVGAGSSAIDPAWSVDNIVVTDACGVVNRVESSSGATLDIAWDEVQVACDSAGPITITYDVTLDSSVSFNQIALNTASIEWSSQDGDESTSTSPYTDLDVERSGDDTAAGGAENDYTTQDTAVASFVFGLGSTKSVVATSDPFTTITPLNMSIGEIITYQINASIPADSFFEDVSITDTLPLGMVLYTDAAAGYNGPDGTFDITVSDPGLTASVGVTNPTVVPVAPTGLFSLDFFSAASPSGDTIHNTTSSIQTITIEYKAVVQNLASNDGTSGSQTTLTNDVELTWLEPIPDDPLTPGDESDPTARGDDSPTPVSGDVVEPFLQVTKTVDTQPTAVNDRTIVYEFEICHTADSTADAFNVVMLDNNPNLVFDPSSISVSSNVPPALVDTTNSSSGQIQIDFDRLPLGFDCVTNPATITFSAELVNTISTDTDLNNQVDIDWESIDPTNDPADEGRDGEDDDTAVGDFDFDIDFSKTIIGDGSESSSVNGGAVIGEVLDFRISIPVPANTFFDDFILSDSLDPGLVFVEFTGIETVDAGASAVSFVTSHDGALATVIDLNDLSALNTRALTGTDPNVLVSNNGRDFFIDFDRLENDSATDIGFVVVEYQALVTNVASNVTGSTVSNAAEINWADTDGPQTKTDAIPDQDILEPELQITKSIIPTAAGESINSSREITYQFVIEHVGDDVDAHDVNVIEDLATIIDPNMVPPAGATGFMDFYMDFVTGSLDETLPVGTTQSSFSEDADGFEIGYDTLAFGETITITFTMIIETPPITDDGTIIENNAEVQWTSLPGDPGSDISPYSTDDDTGIERDGDDTDNPEDDYVDGDSVATTAVSYADLELSKTVDEDRSGIGENVIFTITIENSGDSDTTGVVVTDQLPAELLFVSAIPSVGVYDEITGLWNIGNMAVNDIQTLDIEVTIDDSSIITNTAFISASDKPDPDSVPGNGIITEDDYDSVEVNARRSSGSRTNLARAACSDPFAINYNPDAFIYNNDTCIYPIISDETAEDLVDLEIISEGDNSTNKPSELGFSYGWERCDCSHQVKNLQKWLNDNQFTLTNNGLGSPGIESDCFGYLTEIAIARFQETYRDLILDPNNITTATGYYGPATHRVLTGIHNGTIPLRTPVAKTAVMNNFSKQANHPEGHIPRLEVAPGSEIKIRSELSTEQEIIDLYIDANPDAFTDSVKEIKNEIGIEIYKQNLENSTQGKAQESKTFWQWLIGLFK